MAVVTYNSKEEIPEEFRDKAKEVKLGNNVAYHVGMTQSEADYYEKQKKPVEKALGNDVELSKQPAAENKKVEPEVEVVDEVEKQYADNIHQAMQGELKLELLGGEETSKLAKEKVAEIISNQPHITNEVIAKKIYKEHENIRRKFEKLKELIQCH